MWTHFKLSLKPWLWGVGFGYMILVLAQCAHAREVWRNADGFVLEAVGWSTSQYDPDYIAVNMLLTLPDNGWALFEGPGALELYIPCKRGWVQDGGIMVGDGCGATGRLTQNGAVAVTAQMRCDKFAAVKLVVRIPRMFPASDCRPTKARWVQMKGGCYVQD